MVTDGSGVEIIFLYTLQHRNASLKHELAMSGSVHHVPSRKAARLLFFFFWFISKLVILLIYAVLCHYNWDMYNTCTFHVSSFRDCVQVYSFAPKV